MGGAGGAGGAGGTGSPAPAGRGGTKPGGPDAVYAEIDRLASTVRELSRTLDDSLITVHRAKSTLAAAVPGEAVAAASALLDQVSKGLERVAETAHAALQSSHVSLGSPNLARARPVSLGEAARHACDVVRPLAGRTGCVVEVDIDARVDAAPAGPMYAVLLNAVQNAIEAVARGKSGAGGGRVCVRLAPTGARATDGRRWCEALVTDDGPGLPTVADSNRFFDLGFTTKRDGAGVGLAVARSIVHGLGGTVTLRSREAGEGGGAELRAWFPLIEDARMAA